MADKNIKENRGFLYPNNNKTKPTHPDFTGSIMIDGKESRLAAWQNKSADGTPYFAIISSPPLTPEQQKSFNRGDEPLANPATNSNTTNNQNSNNNYNNQNNYNQNNGQNNHHQQNSQPNPGQNMNNNSNNNHVNPNQNSQHDNQDTYYNSTELDELDSFLRSNDDDNPFN